MYSGKSDGAGNFFCAERSGSLRERDFKGTNEDIEQPAFIATINHLDHQHGCDEAANGLLIRAAADAHRVRSFARLPEGLDSPRYRALGNAVTVSVIQWIARRIIAYEEKKNKKRPRG